MRGDNDGLDSSCRRWLFRDGRFLCRLIECQINYATQTRRVRNGTVKG